MGGLLVKTLLQLVKGITMGNSAKREVYPNFEFFLYGITGWSLNDMGDRGEK